MTEKKDGFTKEVKEKEVIKETKEKARDNAVIKFYKADLKGYNHGAITVLEVSDRSSKLALKTFEKLHSLVKEGKP